MESETTIEQTPATVHHLIKFEVTPDQIRRMGEQYAALTFDDPERYEEGRKALATLRTTRVAIEERRKELKQSALEWGRKVDGKAKELTALIVAVEEPLKAKKLAVDEEKERAKREAAEAEKRALEEQIRKQQEEAEAKRKELLAAEERRLEEERAKLEAEKAQLAEERRVAEEKAAALRAQEEARLAEERAKLEAERERLAMEERARQAKIEQEDRAREEQARIAREAIEAEERRVEALRIEQERAEFERQATIRAEEEARARAERERIEAEERRIAELERKERERVRLEALKPDVEKVHGFAAAIRDVIRERRPEVKSEEALDAIGQALHAVMQGVDLLEDFGAVEQAPAAEGRLVGAQRAG